jgi:hypothetical protein
VEQPHDTTGSLVPRRGGFLEQPIKRHLAKRPQRLRKGRHPDFAQHRGCDRLFGSAVAVPAPILYLSGEQGLKLSEIRSEAGGTAHGFRLLSNNDHSAAGGT